MFAVRSQNYVPFQKVDRGADSSADKFEAARQHHPPEYRAREHTHNQRYGGHVTVRCGCDADAGRNRCEREYGHGVGEGQKKGGNI